MPIQNIIINNLAVKQASLVSIADNIEATREPTIDDYINFCMKVKPTQDCDALFLEDFTDYQELDAIDTSLVSISATFMKKTATCGVPMCAEKVLSVNGKLVFENIDMDGVYGVIVNITYSRVGFNPFTKTLMIGYTKDCCAKKFTELAKTIWCKMASVSCTIVKYSKIGRKISELKKNYIKLSNLMWVYDNSYDGCYEIDKVYCLYNKIKVK